MRIALDAMGGDYAPKNTIEGAVLALKEYPYIEKLFLVGDAVATGNELKRLDFKDARIEIFHASEVVSMKESAAKPVRHKKDASICRAVDLVKNGSAHAVVSAGHTGAALVACVLKLRTLKGIDRPAIACLLPTQNKVFVLIDGGANPDANPGNLVQFAIMGSVFSAHVLGYNNPSVALMSIGEEDMRSNDMSALDDIRMLLGLNLPEQPAFALILVGDPYLLSTLRLRSHRALYSRIAAHTRIEGLSRSEVEPYLEHQLRQVGIERPCFEPAAIELLASASEGIPRTINLVARAAWIRRPKTRAFRSALPTSRALWNLFRASWISARTPPIHERT
jgi:Fatty acid synthesis protein